MTQDTLKQPVNPTTGQEILCLTSEEATTLRKALKATHHLFAVPQSEWTQVFWKVSLVMTQYFAECPDPAILHRYMVCMELFSDFMQLQQAINEAQLEQLIAKLV